MITFSSTDEKLVNLIAETWIQNNGDAKGFRWLEETIYQKILQMEKQ